MSQPPSHSFSRRRWFAGAGAVAGAAAVATVLPGAGGGAPSAPSATPVPPKRGGGYSVSEHVRRYYQTTRV